MSTHRVVPKRVCFIAGTLGRGGAERQLFYMLKTLVNRGVDCRVLCLTHGEEYEKEIRNLGVPVLWVGRKSSPFARFWTITNQVRKWQPDIVQSAHSYTSLYAIVATLVCRKASITAVRSQGLKELLSLGLWGRLSLALSQHIVGNSHQGIHSIQERYPTKRLFLLNNVVDCDAFSPSDVASNCAEKTIHVLTCGRLVALKRQDMFLKAFALARKFSPELRASIVGSGPLRDNLIVLAKALNIEDYVSFFESTTEMVEHYRNAHIFVLTSDHEGTPNVVLEAMACGLPVIATAVGGTKELVKHEQTGYLVPPDDYQQIAKHIVTLANCSQLRERQGRAARAIVEEEYCLSSLDKSLFKLYATILSE